VSFRIEWSDESIQRLRKLDRAVAKAIAARVSKLAIDPFHFGKRLHGLELWTLRSGMHRVLYTIDVAKQMVFIVTLGPRESVYDRR
jgi:mRNA interferase RelE/StbE